MLALVLALACAPSTAPKQVLPAWVSVAAVLNDGSRVSLVAALKTPGEPPELRFSMGLMALDGAQVLRPNKNSEDLTQDWVDMLSHHRSPPPELQTPLLANGPGQGFRLEQRGEQVLLTLPHSPQPFPLLNHVSQLVHMGLWTQQELSPATRRLLKRRFKSVRALYPVMGEAQVDGDLREWAQPDALAIGDASQVLVGEGEWEGPSDAGLAVAVQDTPQGLVLGLRVMDDELGPQDILELRLAGFAPWDLAMGAESPCPLELSCAVTDVVGGRALELALPNPIAASAELGLPLLVR